MNRGLDALKRIKGDMAYQLRMKGECVVNDDFQAVERELRAFETIVDKIFDRESLSGYVDMCFEKGLITEEEYDSLREALR